MAKKINKSKKKIIKVAYIPLDDNVNLDDILPTNKKAIKKAIENTQLEQENEKMVWPKGVILHNGIPFIQTPDGQWQQYQGCKVKKQVQRKVKLVWPKGVIEHNGIPFVQTPYGQWLQYTGQKIETIVEVPINYDEEAQEEFVQSKTQKKTASNQPQTIYVPTGIVQSPNITIQDQKDQTTSEKVVIKTVEKPVIQEKIVEKIVEKNVGEKVVGLEDKPKSKKITIISWILISVCVILAVTLAIMYFLKVRQVNIDYSGMSAAEYDAALKAALDNLKPWLISFVTVQGLCVLIVILMHALQSYFIGNHFDKLEFANVEDKSNEQK